MKQTRKLFALVLFIVLPLAMANRPGPARSELLPFNPLATADWDGYEVVSVTTSIDTDTPKSITAQCPAGKVMIGGGANTFGTTNGTALTASAPASGSPTTGWLAAAADHEDFGQNWGLRADVLCVNAGSSLAQYDIAEGQSSNDSISPKTAAIACPAGKVLVGGGARISGNVTNQGVTASTVQTGNQWSAAAHEITATDSDWQLHAYALCADVRLYATTTLLTGNSANSSKTASVICSTTRVAGGGARLTGTTDGYALTAISTIGNGMSAAGHKVLQAAVTQNWSLQVDALCEPNQLYLPVIRK